jgi:predicted aconitase with swiveling domain
VAGRVVVSPAGRGSSLILGKLLQNEVDELILTANEVELAQLDALVKTEGIPLLDCVIKQLIDRKSEGGIETNMSGPVSVFIWPCPQSF